MPTTGIIHCCTQVKRIIKLLNKLNGKKENIIVEIQQRNHTKIVTKH